MVTSEGSAGKHTRRPCSVPRIQESKQDIKDQHKVTENPCHSPEKSLSNCTNQCQDSIKLYNFKKIKIDIFCS